MLRLRGLHGREADALIDAHRDEVVRTTATGKVTAGAAGGEITQPAPAQSFFVPGRTYVASEAPGGRRWCFRCDTLTTHPEDGERTALGWRRWAGQWEPHAYAEDDWELLVMSGIADSGSGGDA